MPNNNRRAKVSSNQVITLANSNAGAAYYPVNLRLSAKTWSYVAARHLMHYTHHFSPCKYYFNILSSSQIPRTCLQCVTYTCSETRFSSRLDLLLALAWFLAVFIPSQTLCNKQCFIISFSAKARGDKPCQIQAVCQTTSQPANQSESGNFLCGVNFILCFSLSQPRTTLTHAHTHGTCLYFV